MIVTAVSQTILIPQNGLTFFAVQGGGLPPPQTFNILNAGQGQMSWNTSVSTRIRRQLAGRVSDQRRDRRIVAERAAADSRERVSGHVGGRDLLRIGESDVAGREQQPAIRVGGVKPAAAGQPHWTAGAADWDDLRGSGQAASRPDRRPCWSQSLNTSPLTFTTGTSTSSGGNWLTVLPPGGTVTAGEPATIVVQPIVDGLAPGVYQGTLTLSFSDGSTRTVTIVFVVTAARRADKRASRCDRDRRAAACPSLLKVVFTELSTGSSVSVGFPGQVTVKVVDDCGAPLVAGNVTTSFSNGDPPIALTSLKDGTWAATWTPEFPRRKRWLRPRRWIRERLTGTAQVSVGFQQFAQPPVVGTGGVVNAASYVPQAPLAPGTLISVFGSKLATRASGDDPSAADGSWRKFAIHRGEQAPAVVLERWPGERDDSVRNPGECRPADGDIAGQQFVGRAGSYDGGGGAGSFQHRWHPEKDRDTSTSRMRISAQTLADACASRDGRRYHRDLLHGTRRSDAAGGGRARRRRSIILLRP